MELTKYNIDIEHSKEFEENLEKKFSPNSSEYSLIISALYFANNVHKDQYRKSGDPYIVHPIAIANKLLSWGMSPETISAGLLHDVIEDTKTTYEDLEQNFGKEIADLVQIISKVSEYSKKQEKEMLNNEYIVRVILSITKDLRPIIVKIADRLHNMETINFLSSAKQILIAQETLDIYSYIAGKIGLYCVKTNLEDICFRIINPIEWSELNQKIQKFKNNYQQYINKLQEKIKLLLNDAAIDYELSYRIKGSYSTWLKMKRGFLFENIHDIFAMRIIVKNNLDCYQVLGLIHLNFIYIKNAFKDFISSPKWNLYQSLHTTIINKNVLIEFQIRTQKMHKMSQLGLASHWIYKQIEDKKEKKIIQSLMDNFFHGKPPSLDLINQMNKNPVFNVLIFNKNEFFITNNQATVLDLAYRSEPQQFKYLKQVFKNGELTQLSSKPSKNDVIFFNYSENCTINEEWLEATNNHNVIQYIKQTLIHEQLTQKNIVNQFEKELKVYSREKKLSKKYKSRLTYLGFKNLYEFIKFIKEIDIQNKEVFDLFFDNQQKWKTSFKIIKKNLNKLIFKNSFILPIQGLIVDSIIFTDCCSKIPPLPLIGILQNNILKVHHYNCKSAQINNGKRIMIEWDQELLESENKLFIAKLSIQSKKNELVVNNVVNAIIKNNGILLNIDFVPTYNSEKYNGIVEFKILNNNKLEQIIANIKFDEFIEKIELL